MLEQIISELKSLEGKNDSYFLKAYTDAIKNNNPPIETIVLEIYGQILDNEKLVTQITSPKLVFLITNYITKSKGNGKK